MSLFCFCVHFYTEKKSERRPELTPKSNCVVQLLLLLLLLIGLQETHTWREKMCCFVWVYYVPMVNVLLLLITSRTFSWKKYLCICWDLCGQLCSHATFFLLLTKYKKKSPDGKLAVTDSLLIVSFLRLSRIIYYSFIPRAVSIFFFFPSLRTLLLNFILKTWRGYWTLL